MQKLFVLIINTFEQAGGAAVAANRLMKTIQKAGIETKMLVRDKQTTDINVFTLNTSNYKRLTNRFRFIWERFIIYLSNAFSKTNLFQVSTGDTGSDISKYPLVQESDILHLHWINQGFLSLEDIKKLLSTDKPVVWTMHDLWPATAICHYPDQCECYHTACFKCPKQVKLPLWDLAKQVFHQKEQIDFSKITFVGCSQWITSMAKKSALLRKAQFVSIPNPIDITIFKPFDKTATRAQLKLPQDKYLVLFAAAKVTDERKGATFFIEACRLLQEKLGDTVEIILMGGHSQELITQLPFQVHTTGYIFDTKTMALVYACVDMFIIPSLEDNLPNTIMESMACGTPCVGFSTGGIPEMIDHKTNGYVARYKDVEDLASGIEWVINNTNKLALREACVEKVQTCYAEPIVAEKYIALYNQLLNRTTS